MQTKVRDLLSRLVVFFSHQTGIHTYIHDHALLYADARQLILARGTHEIVEVAMFSLLVGQTSTVSRLNCSSRRMRIHRRPVILKTFVVLFFFCFVFFPWLLPQSGGGGDLGRRRRPSGAVGGRHPHVQGIPQEEKEVHVLRLEKEKGRLAK